MSSSEKYNIWFSLTVEHEYYAVENCSIQLHMLPETKSLFKQYGILCKRMKLNQWLFLTRSLEIENEQAANLHFELIPEDPILYYVTDILEDSLQGDNYEMKISAEIKKWIELVIPIQQNMKNIHLSLNSKSKYLEYIIIKRYQKNNIQIKIEERKQQIKFAEPKALENLLLGEGFRITSVDKLKMEKAYGNYMLQLVEIKENGERILCNNLPFPQPHETSILSPYDTITAYYYI